MLLLIAYRCNTEGPNSIFVPTYHLSQIKSLEDFSKADLEQVKKELESDMNNKAFPFKVEKFTYLCRLVAFRQK